VRFDTGHKKNAFLAGTLGRFVEWVPVCPEVECGLGTPREAMRLVQASGRLRLLTTRTGADLTERLDGYARRRVEDLAREDLNGYVLKKDSPSCGLERVKVYDTHAVPSRSGRGLFAARLVERFPHLPIEEEGRLSDPRLRENFIVRVFAFRRLRNLFSSAWTAGALVRFHAEHKLLLLAHSPAAYRTLGRLVADARAASREQLEAQYTHVFMTALRRVATPGGHTNVLQHMSGYFKRHLDLGSKRELTSSIEEYRRGVAPMSVPLTLVRHYLRVHDVAYLKGQRYLNPYPRELSLSDRI
jgi:uncharacterized protein YbgA (DUF1722 family)/uncharacterized protein YbbK (DUF523 family)